MEGEERHLPSIKCIYMLNLYNVLAFKSFGFRIMTRNNLETITTCIICNDMLLKRLQSGKNHVNISQPITFL